MTRSQPRREMRAAGGLAHASFAEYEGVVLRALEESQTALDGYAAANVAPRTVP